MTENKTETPVEFAIRHTFEISMLFGGDPLVVISGKNFDYVDAYKKVLDMQYRFFDTFGDTGFFVQPFVQKNFIEFSFYVHTSDVRDDPEFLTRAESWICGYLEGMKK